MEMLTKKTRTNIKNASKVLGVREKDILERASLFYLDAIKGELEFKKELDFWNYLSDEALANRIFLTV